MQRVLKSFCLKSLFLLIPVLALAQTTFATTVVVPSDDEMIIGARAILRGKVVAMESSFDETHTRIYTYITVKVQEVIKGEITERFVVLKELGGQVGDRGMRVFGNAVFTRSEKVVLYLDTWKDGSLRTYQMYLGKFSITEETTGEQFVGRSSPDDNVSVRPNRAQSSDAATDRMELSAYLQMVRSRLAANWERSLNFQDTYYHDLPLLKEPLEYQSLKSEGDIEPRWVYISSAHPRWFEPDSGQSVNFVVNPASAPQPNIANDVNAAMNAWSTVPSCALRVANAGSTTECNEGVGLNLIQFSGCDGRWSPGGGCSGVLALGGLSWFGSNTRVVNGVTFVQATAGFVSINPNAACYFTSHCNIQEVLTHELGHAMGLGHTTDNTATMYAYAHFDGRCAAARPDDMAGVQFIYPGTGGGPGPLTVTTSSLANGTVGSTYSQTLQRTGGTSPYSWSIVAGLGNLPTGLSLNASTGVISGTPTVTGTSNFTVRVTDAASATADKALSIVISASGGAALDAQYVSQTVPTTLNPGQSFNSNMKFLNTGTQTWSGAAFYLASQNPSLNQTWGGNGVSLSSFVVAPGQQLDVTFSAVAPTTPGTYNFQWQPYQNGGIGFFGQMSPNVVIQVGNPPPPPTQYQGYIDGAGCNIVTGWAWNANQPSSSINVDIYDGSTFLATVRANLFREDVLNAGVGTGFNGFSFTVPQSLKNGQPHVMRAFFGGTTTELANSSRQIICSGAPQVYQGYHDGAGCNTISGWAWDANDPSSPINVDIYDGTTLIATIPAIIYRQDLQAAGIGNGYHGFSYTVPTSLKDGNLHAIRIRFPGTSTDLGNTPRTIGCSGAAPQFQGTHEVANCNVISGWAWDQNDPNSPINVAIYADGQWIATVLAIGFRSDLVSAGIGNGYHAFSFNTPASLKNGQTRSITVKYSGTATSLSSSLKSVICSPP